MDGWMDGWMHAWIDRQTDNGILQLAGVKL